MSVSKQKSLNNDSLFRFLCRHPLGDLHSFKREFSILNISLFVCLLTCVIKLGWFYNKTVFNVLAMSFDNEKGAPNLVLFT